MSLVYHGCQAPPGPEVLLDNPAGCAHASVILSREGGALGPNSVAACFGQRSHCGQCASPYGELHWVLLPLRNATLRSSGNMPGIQPMQARYCC
jgi:hypothetical protein